MRVSEIRVKRIRVNQGLGVFDKIKTIHKKVILYCKVSSLKVRLTDKVLHLTDFVSYHKSILVSTKRIDVSGSNITQAVHTTFKERK